VGGARSDVLEAAEPLSGHGRRLTAAFAALEGLPALAESRGRLLRAVRSEPVEPSEIVAAIGSDVALAISVLRLANASQPEVAGVAGAVEVLSPAGIERLAEAVEVFDFFEAPRAWTAPPERFRAHAVATQHAAERLARATAQGPLDEVLTAALLHDVGKLVLGHAYRGYPEQVHGPAGTPEERVRRERDELGVDHARVGGVLVRRWGLPDRLAAAVEHHHDDEPEGLASLIRLADALARFAHGEPIDMEELVRLGELVGLDREQLGALLYDLPYPVTAERALEGPCPLTARELEVLAQLVEGKVYKQIAQDLGVATSTIRNHLHSAYSKLGVVDRTQAVLVAKERSWI
jgi:putative nucleotidyltransferase with HDIG domain